MSPPSPSPGRWPTLVLLLASMVGVPGSLIAVFKDQVLQHPGLTVLCVLVWELLVLVAGLVKDASSKPRDLVVTSLADWAYHSIQSLISRYRRRYLDWIFYRHRDFDVKGLTTQSTYNLELEQVFVDLTIQPSPPGGNPADLIRPFPKELTGRRSIWDYLTSEQFTDHLALIGAPGSGKTTLLKKIALQLTGRRRPKIRQKLPILLFLREHAEAILADPSPSLADVASADLARKHCSVLPPVSWFKGKLDDGRCLVLLDGLDEVASQDVRQKVVTWVEDQIKAFPRNRFLISSRPHGYRSSPVSGVTLLEIQPFNRNQVRQFVQNWYRANEIHASGKDDPGVEMKAREGAEDLLRRLGNSQTLTDLAVNPLLLTMIATVHRFRSSLPGRRVELYAEICEVFLGKRRQAQGIETDLTPAQKQRVLQPLAYQLMWAKKRDIPTQEAVTVIAESLRRVAGERSGSPEADFLKETENSSGLLLERESGIYSFAHLAFQEYLTAVHIRENGLVGELVAKVTDPWWHEVIRLYGAQSDASGILAACLSSERPTVLELSLAIDCLEEAREAAPEWRAKIDSFLQEGAESTDPDRFRLAAETLLARRLRNMVAVNENTFVDSNYISHAEYQLFLDEKRATGKHYQPDHWQEFRFPAGQATTSAVGMRSSDASAFCDWLSSRDGASSFRLPQPGELENHRLGAKQNLSGTAEGFWTTDGFERVGPSVPFFYWEDLISRDLSEKSLTSGMDCDIERASIRDLINNLDRTRATAQSFSSVRGLESTYGLANDLYRARNIASEIDRILKRDIDHDTAMALYRAVAHARGRALDIDRVVTRASNNVRQFARDRAISRKYASDIDRGHVRARVIASDLNRDLAIARDSTIDFALDLASAREFARNLARDLAGSHISDLACKLANNLDRASNIDCNLASNLASKLALAQVLDRSLNHTLTRSLGRALTRSLDGSLDRALNRALDRHLNSAKFCYDVRWIWRIYSLYLATSPHLRSRLGLRRWFESRREKIQTYPSQEVWLLVYGNLILLEARIEGLIPAFEGIRIVKEIGPRNPI